MLEMSTTWTYRRFQEVLASFLQPAVDHPFKLRLHGCELTDVRPARLNRALYKAAELDMKEYSPQSTMPQVSLKEGKEDVLFFEVLPFPMPDMDTYLVKDVVVNDATLRRAAAPSAAKLTNHRTPKVRVHPSPLPFGLAVSCPDSPSLLPLLPLMTWQRPKPAAGQPGDPAPASPLRVRPAPVEWTMWSTGGDPLVATVLLAREASVGNLVEAMDDLLGLDTRRKGPPHVRIVLADAHYRIQQVMRWDQDVEQLPDSHLKALMPSPFPGRLMDARGKVMYEVVEKRELDLLTRLRSAKLGHADLLRRRAAAATNGGGGVDEEKHRESGGENGGGGRLRGDGDEEEREEDEEAEEAEDDSIKFLPLQVRRRWQGQGLGVGGQGRAGVAHAKRNRVLTVAVAAAGELRLGGAGQAEPGQRQPSRPRGSGPVHRLPARLLPRAQRHPDQPPAAAGPPHRRGRAGAHAVGAEALRRL